MSREPPEPTDSNFATVVGVFSSSVSGSPHREEQRDVEAHSVAAYPQHWDQCCCWLFVY